MERNLWSVKSYRPNVLFKTHVILKTGAINLSVFSLDFSSTVFSWGIDRKRAIENLTRFWDWLWDFIYYSLGATPRRRRLIGKQLSRQILLKTFPRCSIASGTQYSSSGSANVKATVVHTFTTFSALRRQKCFYSLDRLALHSIFYNRTHSDPTAYRNTLTSESSWFLVKAEFYLKSLTVNHNNLLQKCTLF